MFDGPQLEELWLTLQSAYELDSLRQLMRFKLGKGLCEIVDCGKPFRNLVFDLFELAEQEGWFPTFLSAVATTRSTNLRVLAFMRNYAPDALVAVRPGELSGKLRTGLEAVADRKNEPGVREVLTRYREDLKAARDGVRILNGYKKLHDCLHKLQVMMVEQLEAAADQVRAGETTAPLALYVYQLRRSAEKAREDAEGLPTKSMEQSWATTLEQIAKLVEQSGTNPAPLDRAAILLRTVLTESPRINAKMTDVVGGLRLEGLVGALKEILLHVAGTAAEGDVNTALAGLAALRPRLSGLIEEHSEWQVIDKAFAVADLMPGSTLTERFPVWEDTHKRLGGLFDLAPAKPWADMLRGQIVELDAAEKAADANRFERAFETFRIVARDRFVEVDEQLLARSGHLANVAPALDQLV